MAKSRRKSKKLARGKCKIVNTPSGRRKLCNIRGKVRFKKMSYSPR